MITFFLEEGEVADKNYVIKKGESDLDGRCSQGEVGVVLVENWMT